MKQRGTYRKKRATRRKQRGGQAPAQVPKPSAFESLKRKEGLEKQGSWKQGPEIHAISPAPVPGLPIPPPRSVEQTPPSSLEFQIFFAQLSRIIGNHELTPQELTQFITVLGDLTKNLYLNSEEILRILILYDYLLNNGIHNVAKPLHQHVTYLKRTGRL